MICPHDDCGLEKPEISGMETKVKHTPTPMFDYLMKYVLPGYLTKGWDPLQQTTVAGLAWMILHEIDLFEEGEESDIKTQAQLDRAKQVLAIVRAVNAHDELVEAIREVLDGWDNPKIPKTTILRKALAKAERP